MSGFHPFGGRVSKHFGENLAPEDAYLSYHDVRLTKEDYDCIRNDWLTDNVIAFWEEYLEHEKLIDFPKAHINLIRPSMSYLLMQTPDPMTVKEALPNLAKTTHIFLPVNDCRNVSEAEGGSHWSLLLVSTVDGVAFHYDSMSDSNDREARIVTQKLATLLNKSFKFVCMEDSPQQDNGSDCGVYVCLLMRYLLLSRLLKADSREKISMGLQGKVVEASQGRKEMVKIIDGFRREGQRRSRSKSPYDDNKDHSKSPPRIGDE